MSLINPAPTPHLILGGARSGKSTHAESLVQAYPPPYVYVATAQPLDDEMKHRIHIHQERRKDSWQTIEAPIALPEAIDALQSHKAPVLVDCLTLWLTNLLLQPGPTSPRDAVQTFCSLIQRIDFPLFIVANEVGAGIVPENALAREFRDLAGFTNQLVAKAAGSVTLVVAGLPLRLK